MKGENAMHKNVCFTGLFLFASLVFLGILSGGSLPANEYGDTTIYYFPQGVIGQGSLYSSGANKVDGKGFNRPIGIAIDTNVTPNHLYVADTLNNRILCWRDIDTAFAGKEADMVLGQPSMFTHSPNFGGISAESLFAPKGIFIARNLTGELCVSDSDNNRVLIFDVPFANDARADFLFGQPDFGSNATDAGGTTSAIGFAGPQRVIIDGLYNLYVADMYNNRILVFNDAIRGTGDAIADRVIGQVNFTGNSSNQGNSLPDQYGLYYPMGIAIQTNGSIWVADKYNNRVVKFEQPIPNVNGAATGLRGQPGFQFQYKNWDGVNFNDNDLIFASGLSWDTNSVCIDPSGRLYVSDTFNNRILRWDDPTSSGPNANYVYGQYGSFNSGAPNFGGFPTAGTLDSPNEIAFDTLGRMYVADSNNNRILRFSNPQSSYMADGVVGQPNFSTADPNMLDGDSVLAPADIAFDWNSSPVSVYVADDGNNRVLCWSDISNALAGAPADIILGQPDPYSYSPGCDQNKFDSPVSVAVDSFGKLWVSDSDNHRVVGFVSPFTEDTNADFLIGQFNWADCLPNMGYANPTSNTLYYPAGIFVDNDKNLWVADMQNNRVLRFPNPYTIASDADFVIGQPGMFSGSPNNPAMGPASLYNPTDVALDPAGNLFICDNGNHRVLCYFYPYFDGVADRVFGQGDSFYSSNMNIDGSDYARGLNYPVSIAINNAGTLFISDMMNKRVVGIFNAASPLYDTTADIVYGKNGCLDCGGYGTVEVSPYTLDYPEGLTCSPNNKLFVVDNGFNRILMFRVPEPPQIQEALYVDTDRSGDINAGDRLILSFSRELMIVSGQELNQGDFNLPRPGDSLGTLFQAEVGVLNPRNLIITLGANPNLLIAGLPPAGSSIDVTTNASAKLVSPANMMPVLPSTPQDIKYIFRALTPQYFGAAGGTIRVLDDPDARFRFHQIFLPAGAVTGNFLFGIFPPSFLLPFASAVSIRAVTESFITLEYTPNGIDLENGYMEKYIRIARILTPGPGIFQPDWRNVPVIIDFVNHTITVKLADLFGARGGTPFTGSDGKLYYGIDGDHIIADARRLVDTNSANVSPDGAKRSGKISLDATLTPGPDGIYILHSVRISTYHNTLSGGYQLTIRQATGEERTGFPSQSGAIFVIESSPDFPSGVIFDMTVEFIPNANPSLTDVVDLSGNPGSMGKMRLVKKNPFTGEFEFISGSGTVSVNPSNTVVTTGLSGLTDGGVGIYGVAVNPAATSLNTAAQNWAIYE